MLPDPSQGRFLPAGSLPRADSAVHGDRGARRAMRWMISPPPAVSVHPLPAGRGTLWVDAGNVEDGPAVCFLITHAFCTSAKNKSGQYYTDIWQLPVTSLASSDRCEVDAGWTGLQEWWAARGSAGTADGSHGVLLFTPVSLQRGRQSHL